MNSDFQNDMRRKPGVELETDVDDTRLLESVERGDQQALAELIHRYAGRVQGLCNTIIADQLEADGVVSEVFMEIWNRPQRYSAQRGTLCGYLMILARSRALDSKRRTLARARQHEKFTVNADHQFSTIDTPMRQSLASETQTRVAAAVDRLPAKQQQALRLAFFSGLSHREVSETLGLPLGTVKTYIRKGLLELRQALSAQLEPGEVQ